MKTKHAREIRAGINDAKRRIRIWGEDAPEYDSAHFIATAFDSTTSLQFDRAYSRIMNRHISGVWDRRRKASERQHRAKINSLRPMIEGDMDHEDFD